MTERPCRHLLAQPARCDLGRAVPADCGGCPAYQPEPPPDLAAALAGGAELRDAERTRCEIWTRVMGYHRPVHAFNAGKRSEHAERVAFREPGRGRAEGGR